MAKKQAWHCHSLIWPFKWLRECWDTTRIPRWIISRWGVQVPSELAANSRTTENHGPSAITMCNQPTEISDDQLRKSVRSLKKMRCKAYNRVLSKTRNKQKNLKSLKSQNVEPVYLWLEVVVLKWPSHGKLKLANSCWQTQVSGRDWRKNSRQTHWQTVGDKWNVFADCFCAVHTHQLEFANMSLPTLVCRVKAA